MMRRMSKKVGKLTGSLAAVLAIVAITGCGSKQQRKSKESKSIVSVSHSLRSMPLLITAGKGFWKD